MKSQLALGVLLSIFIIGCGPPAAVMDLQARGQLQTESFGSTPYLLGPGDGIEVIYRIGYKADTSQYSIGVGDQLNIEFYSNSQLNRSLTVLPDGTIAIPPKGIIKVIGQSPRQLSDSLTKLFSVIIRDPIITVTVREYNQNAQDFIRAVTSTNQGQAKVIQVSSDGKAVFPFLDEIDVMGLTISQLRAIVSRKYESIVPNLLVSLSLNQAVNNVAYAMGEVRRPGLVEITRPTTVTQLLSQAQVNMSTANLSTVAVISLDKDRKPTARLVDVSTLLKHGNMACDILVKQYDVIYVPMRPIASAELFVQQYFGTIYGVVPNFFHFGVNADYQDILNSNN